MKEVKALPEIDVEKADKIVQRSIVYALSEQELYKPEHETMICACGYEGKPLCIIEYDDKHNMFVCPKCGDA